MLPMIIEKHLRTWKIKCWEIWNSETRFESLNCPWLPSHSVWIMLQKCSWEILLGKQLIPWERSTNMQMRFMTWSACLKGLCVTSRHFHQAEKKKKFAGKRSCEEGSFVVYKMTLPEVPILCLFLTAVATCILKRRALLAWVLSGWCNLFLWTLWHPKHFRALNLVLLTKSQDRYYLTQADFLW